MKQSLIEEKVHLAKEMGIELKENEISTAHRLGNKTRKPGQVIVRFITGKKRTKFLKKKKSLNGKPG